MSEMVNRVAKAETKIERMTASWNPIRARRISVHGPSASVGWHCEKVSAGCANCYAETTNKRIGTGLDFKPDNRDKVELFLDEKKLLAPLHWRKPRMIFVCSMTDLFADFVPDEWIDRIFAVMALCPQHVFPVSTKRTERMREWAVAEQTPFRVARAIDGLRATTICGQEEIRPIAGYPGYFASSYGTIYSERRGKRKALSPDIGEEGHSRVQLYRGIPGERGDRLLVHRLILKTFVGQSPTQGEQGRHLDGNALNNAAKNLKWGDQESNWSDSKRHGTHRRYSKLTPANVAEIRSRHANGETGESLAREFAVSSTQIRNIASGRQWNVEPPIKWPLRNVWKGISCEDQATADERTKFLRETPAAVRFLSLEPMLGPVIPNLTGISWCIVGGESGHGARPMHPDWARGLRDQCAAANVPFFFKQWGEWGQECAPPVHDAYRWPIRHDEQNGGVWSYRVGKKRAGRLLDGKTYDEMPK